MTRPILGLLALLALAACGAAAPPTAEGGRTGVTLGGDAYFGVSGEL